MADALDTNAKALKLNLDESAYGTFAEIGGGQEVSRWFFRVGGAAGTVAKTISAYDKNVSDSIYGAGDRYVSRERVKAMLNHEFSLLQERLVPARGDSTGFFVFADTVATRNYKGTNECHGWIGLRMQHRPGAAPSDILLHVNLLDASSLQQQQSLGLLGVNLIFAAYYQREPRAIFLGSLMDGLSPANLEIDVIDCSGEAFPECLNPTVVAVEMLSQGLTSTLIFDERGIMDQPSSVLRKRGLLVLRCALDRENPVMNQMLDTAGPILKAEIPGAQREPLPLLELSMAHEPGEEKPLPPNAVERLDSLLRTKRAVMATSHVEMFRISNYFRRYSGEPVRFLIGLDTVVQILRDYFYTEIDGGLLEGLGRLLDHATRLYVYSMSAEVFHERLKLYAIEDSFCTVPDKPILTLADVQVTLPAGHLLNFLRDAGWVLGADMPTA